MTTQQDQDVISPQQAVTLHGLFLERVRRSPDKIAYRYFDVRQSVWVDLSWSQMLKQVARWQAALAKEGLAKGDRVAIMLRNCPQWVMFDQAAMSLGLITVPLYTVDRADNIAYIVNDSEVKVMLFETASQWNELSGVIGQMECVQRFVSLDEFESNEARVVSAARYLPEKADLQSAPLPNPGGTTSHSTKPASGQVAGYLPQAGEGANDALRAMGSNELASIIYTSGTTGRPKGVMLSHNNMLSNAYDVMETFTVNDDDLMLSFLPLSHTFERTCGYYLQVTMGATVAYARSIPLLAEDLQIIRPTILIAVPRIYERVYAAISAKLAEGSPLKRMLFNLAVEVGWARFLHGQGRGGWKLSFLLWPLLQKLVAQKILARLGVGDVAVNGEHDVVGGQRLGGAKEAEVPQNHSALVFGKRAGLLPQLDVLLHRDLLGHPVVGDTFFVVRARPRVAHGEDLIRVGG